MPVVTDEKLDCEFAYTRWDFSCQDPYVGSSDLRQCRRPARHDGDHAAGFAAHRVRWGTLLSG